MNPFELAGPQFLLFYLVFGFVLIGSVVVLRRSFELDSGMKVQVTDPYAIAFLRGGAAEAMRLASTGLIDRRLLAMDEEEKLKVSDRAAPKLVSDPLESAILEHFRTKNDIKSMFTAAAVQEQCARIKAGLEERGLMPNGMAKVRNILICFAAIAILWFTALIKIDMALTRHHPFGFLIILVIVFTIVMLVLMGYKRTVRGEHFVVDMKNLFEPLRKRSANLVARNSNTDALLMGAVFGVTALPEGPYPYVKKLFQKPDSSSSGCGSSSSSSCGSSSCGGGGCGGGCGGCGS